MKSYIALRSTHFVTRGYPLFRGIEWAETEEEFVARTLEEAEAVGEVFSVQFFEDERHDVFKAIVIVKVEGKDR